MARSSWRSLFGCFSSHAAAAAAGKKKMAAAGKAPRPSQSLHGRMSFSDLSLSGGMVSPEDLSLLLAGSDLHVFTIAELRAVTRDFSRENFVGEGRFGPVYKGYVDKKVKPGLRAQLVAVKRLDLERNQGHNEWLTEVIFLGQLRHPHLVKLIGFCYEDEHYRFLVYEYMARGSLEKLLFNKYAALLKWSTRLEIAIGAAKGLAFLHEAENPLIYREFKTSNILVDWGYKAKLSDFGLAKDGPEEDETHVSTRVMGTQGYAAPEYIKTGHLTAKSDVYGFGVVLLELLTGRRSVDEYRPPREQNLVDWARPYLNDSRRLARVMDPNLSGLYDGGGAQKFAALAYKCVSLNPKSRPHMSAVVSALEPLLALEEDSLPASILLLASPDNGGSGSGSGNREGRHRRRAGRRRSGDAAESVTVVIESE